jgi:hypothetical protein
VSNWFLSLGEDVFVVGLSTLALAFPIAAGTLALALLVVIGMCSFAIARALRRRFGRPPADGGGQLPTVNASV